MLAAVNGSETKSGTSETVQDMIAAAGNPGRSGGWLAGLGLLAFDLKLVGFECPVVTGGFQLPYNAAPWKQPRSAVDGHVVHVGVTHSRPGGCRGM